jgi:hypothetical protein
MSAEEGRVSRRMELVRPIRSTFWELRGCWATGRRVALSIDADLRRAEGFVTSVAATDAYVKIGDLLIPGDRILALHYPSRLGDSSFEDRPGTSWDGRPRRRKPLEGEIEMEFGGLEC